MQAEVGVVQLGPQGLSEAVFEPLTVSWTLALWGLACGDKTLPGSRMELKGEGGRPWPR